MALTLKETLIALDMFLTGHTIMKCEHTYASQARNLVERLESDAYYLSEYLAEYERSV